MLKAHLQKSKLKVTTRLKPPSPQGCHEIDIEISATYMWNRRNWLFFVRDITERRRQKKQNLRQAIALPWHHGAGRGGYRSRFTGWLFQADQPEILRNLAMPATIDP